MTNTEDLVKRLAIITQDAYSKMFLAHLISRDEYERVFEELNIIIRTCNENKG